MLLPRLADHVLVATLTLVHASDPAAAGEEVRAEGSVFIPPRGTSLPHTEIGTVIPQVQQAMAEPLFIQEANKLAEVQVISNKRGK